MLALSQLRSLMNNASVAVFVLFPLSPSLVFQSHICLCGSGRRRHGQICCLSAADVTCVVVDGGALWCCRAHFKSCSS